MTTPLQVISDVTIANYKRMAYEAATQNKPSLSYLKEKGGFKRDEGGTALNWPVHGTWYTNYVVADYEDVSGTYVPQKQDVQATQPWGELFTPVVVSKGELRQNRGGPALVNLSKERMPRAFKGLLTQGTGSLNYKFLNGDGTATGQDMYGLASVFQYDDVLASVQEPTITSAATYAGKSLEAGVVLAELDGTGDNYIWTPRAANIDYTGLVATTTGGKFLEAMRDVQLKLTFDNGDSEMKPDLALTTQDVFNAIRQNIVDKQNIYIDRPGSQDNAWGLGAGTEKLWEGGIWISWDVDMPTRNSTGLMYVLNFDQLCFRSLATVESISADKVTMSKGDDMGVGIEVEQSYNDGRRAATISLTLPGQFQIMPRYQGVVGDFTA